MGHCPVFSIGSPTPPTNKAEVELIVSKNEVSIDVKNFLDQVLKKHRANSVVFISFGTVWWSAEPEKIWTILDVLIERGIPFLFSHASPIGVIPDEVSARIEASGLGYTAKWLPQQMILQHEACGWFMLHCGHNSVMESLTAGVPLICWPYDADQPMNAANIAFVHKAGYELFEVRNGQGLRPVHRLGDKAPEGTLDAVRREVTEVLTKAQSEDGQKRRAKAQWFSREFSRSWELGGLAWVELGRLLEVLA
ncbi:UDP-Glycosyltransferase/glycogen phosphorylase [Fomitiporia mediterranea MF3/22]|uniref:UDP-Glycosyltransferase/glycogen phosphorylase n=1 Tax=Fomitiporia mediterranea (strain MF3/22) TaxID=694068 RepID=UPI00044075F4|nr:UDP-Glycosyltransferase/glycogen phosphorylase [Fomitiporia mediterranea MF3/22]EJD00712.1 UDP-Glycosyltransferase/glycogen phosphorylase [Fomitiporia mediterranea MF3/22]